MILLFVRKLIIGILCVGGLLFCQGCDKEDDKPRMDYGVLNPQKDFTLTDQDGKAFHLKDYRGKTLILFFGYTQCPDVCPTTLSRLTRAYSLLGEEGKKVLTLFVSIDPQRDTPEKLKEYLEYFKLNAIGLTGTKQQIDEVVEAYKAMYQKVDMGSAAGYLFDHSDYLYLIDKEGKVRHLFHPDDKPEQMAKVIKKIL